MTSFRSEILGQNDVPSLIFRLVLSLFGPTHQPLVHSIAQNNAAKRSIPATERPKVSHRLQSNPQVAQSNPQVDTQVAQSMFKVPQGCSQVTQPPEAFIFPRKTEVRSRSGWEAAALPGPKIHPVGPCLAQNNVAKRIIPATERPKSHS